MNNVLKYANFIETDPNRGKLGSYDDLWCNEYNGNTFVTISHILIERGELFITCHNI